MSGRVLMVILGLVVAYFAIYAGDGVNVFFVANASPEASGLIVIGFMASILLMIILAVFGGITWGIFMSDVGSDLGRARDQESAKSAALSLVCLSYLFGLFAAPFTNYGPYPWYWASKWDVLFVLALVPTVLVFHGVALDLVEARRRKKTAQGKVTSISRSA